MSPVLFSLAIDWVLRNTTKGKRKDMTSILQDLGYVKDLTLNVNIYIW